MAQAVYPSSLHIVQNSRELSVKGASAPPFIGGLPLTGGPGCSMVAELIDHIEVYHAEKQDGITNQRVVIHYNCIGAFDVPDRRKIPEQDILLETRKGVALSYAPAV